MNNYTNNLLQSYDQKNQSLNNLSNYELRKIIKEEFESQIIPYKKEIFSLKEEINNIYNSLNRESIESLIKEIKLSLYNFVEKKYFNQKIEEMNSKININDNNFNKPQNKIINNIISEIKKMKLEINNIKINNNPIYNSNRHSFPLKQIEKEPAGNIINLNEIKSKDMIDKISFIKVDVENLKEEIKSFQNSILENKKNLNELELKFGNLKTDSSSNKSELIREVKKFKEDIKKFKDDLNQMKKANEKNTMNFLNQNNDFKIYEILEKLNLTKLSNFDMDKYNIICGSYEKLMKNYINITKIVGHQNDNIIKLNNQIKENSLLSKQQAKKEIKNYSDDNNILQKKYEILERQMQYLQNRVEKISLDAINIKDANLDYEKRKEEDLLMKQEINKISNQMAVYNAFIEENNKKREELNMRIDETKKEIKEEKNVGLENKMNLLQYKNNIQTNQEKLNELEKKSKDLEDIIIKLNEEKLKKLEDQIIRIDEKITANIEEGKKLDEIKNEINENNKRNNNERLNEIENKLNMINDAVNSIKTEKKENNNIEEFKIKMIEEQIKQLSENKFKDNEFEIKNLLSEEIEKKVNNNSKNIIKIEDRISKLEEETNNIKKEIKEIKAKNNNQVANEIQSQEMAIKGNSEKKEEEEKKESENSERKEEIKDEEPKKNHSLIIGYEVGNQNKNQDDDQEFDDYEPEEIENL